MLQFENSCKTLNYLRVVELSIQVFHEIAKAESNIHSVPISEVHFHEVGAVDSIVDTVGVILGLDMMLKRGINCVYVVCVFTTLSSIS